MDWIGLLQTGCSALDCRRWAKIPLGKWSVTEVFWRIRPFCRNYYLFIGSGSRSASLTIVQFFSLLKYIAISCATVRLMLSAIKSIKKLKGYDTFYRIRLGNYRIGLEMVEDVIIFARILHRKDVYRYFP